MDNQALIDGIRQHIDAGHSKELIHKNVLEAGYTDTEFDAAYSAALEAAEHMSAPETKTPAAAAPDQAPTNSSPTSASESGRRSNRLLLVIGGVLVVLTLATGVAYAFSAGLLSAPAFLSGLLSSPPYEEGEVLEGMRDGFGQVHSGNYSVSLVVEAVEKDADTYLLPAELHGDEGDPSTFLRLLPKEFKVSGSMSGNFDTGSVSVSKSYSHITGSYETPDFSMHGDVEFILSKDDGGFLRVNRMPSLFFVDFSPIKGEWIHLFTELPEELFAEMRQTTTPEAGLSSDEQFELAFSLASKHQLFTVAAPIEEEEINGTTAYKYTMTLRREAIRPFLEELIPALDETYGDRLDEAELDRLTNAAFVEYVNTHYQFHVWARADGIPVRYGLSSRVAVDDDAPSPLESARVKGTDAAKKQRMSNFRAQAELYYDDNNFSYEGFCATSNVEDPFVADRREDWRVTCNDTAEAYAAMISLSDSSFCIDSTGYADAGSLADPGATRCSSAVVAPEPDGAPEAVADRQVNLTVYFDLTNINEPIEVEVPEGAMSIEDAAEQVPLLRFFSSELREEARREKEDVRKQRQLDSMSFYAELSFSEHGDYSQVCADLREGALERHTINSPTTECRSTAEAYVIWAPLHDGSYCVDSADFAGAGFYTPENGVRCTKGTPGF